MGGGCGARAEGRLIILYNSCTGEPLAALYIWSRPLVCLSLSVSVSCSFSPLFPVSVFCLPTSFFLPPSLPFSVPRSPPSQPLRPMPRSLHPSLSARGKTDSDTGRDGHVQTGTIRTEMGRRGRPHRARTDSIEYRNGRGSHAEQPPPLLHPAAAVQQVRLGQEPL